MPRFWNVRPAGGANPAMKLSHKEAIINRFKAAMAKTFGNYSSFVQKH
jgi:hypothetical protein